MEVAVAVEAGVAEGAGVEVSVGVDDSSLHANKGMTDAPTTRTTDVT